MDHDKDALVTCEEWMSWLKTTHDKKGPGKGGKWMLQLLYTLRTNTYSAKLQDMAALSPEQAIQERTAALKALSLVDRQSLWDKIPVEERKLLPTFDIHADDAMKVFGVWALCFGL